VADLSLMEQALDATRTIVVATAIVNVWTNSRRRQSLIQARIAARRSGSCWASASAAESIARTEPAAELSSYLDELITAKGPAGARARRARAALSASAAGGGGTHPSWYRVYSRTRNPQPGALLAPEHKAVVSADADQARAIGRCLR
jgi:hypothetical protein